MLARTLLPAAALGIPERMHAALLLVLSKLERGELVHGPTYNAHDNPTDEPDIFNMRDWDCGSAHCILGWARQLSGDNESSHKRRQWSDTVSKNKGLYSLCYPIGGASYDDITTDQAASALRNYLATGNPDWAGVLG